MVHDGSPDASAGVRRQALPRAVWAVAVVALIAGGAAAFWYWPRPAPVGPALLDGDDVIAEPVVANPGYVGPQACAACHAERVAEFQGTNHFRACRYPTPDTMPAGFDSGSGSHVTREPGLRFEMTKSGNDFFQTSIRTTPKGEERTPARIALAYGAGGLDEVYFTWHGDRLYELPMVWLHPLHRWGNTSLNRFGAGDFSRETTARCLECHNTWFAHVPGSSNQYKPDSFILGVSCERCHGPGRDHVAFHTANPQAAAKAVVHPGRLPRERQIEVCTQCHSNANKRRGPPFAYRPGEPLDAHFRTATSQYPEDDHVANQVKYLRTSQCFAKSDTLTCTTCHNPHRPTEPESVRRACNKCHQAADCREQPRLPAGVRGDCVGCHMPPRIWINVHFHIADDEYVPPIRRQEHHIAVDPVARQEVLRTWYLTQPDAAARSAADELTKSLVEHWLAEAEKRRRSYRFLGAIGALREALRIDPAPAIRDKLRAAIAARAKLDADQAEALHLIDERRFPQAIETLNRLLSIKPDSALAHGRLGTLFAATGKNELAVRELRLVEKYDPDDPYGENMLGWLAYTQGRPAEAVEAFRRADAIDPYTAVLNYRLGLALLKLDRLPEAGERFRLVLTIDPNHAGGAQGLSHVLLRQGQPADAVLHARQAAKLTKYQNADILVTLVEAYSAAGRSGEADAAAARALDAARQADPGALPQIRRRLDEVRANRQR